MDRYVTSRELAERLKAANYPQKTIYEWCQPSIRARELGKTEAFVIEQNRMEPASLSYHSPTIAAAPNVDELRANLPHYVKLFRDRDGNEVAGCVSLDPAAVNGHDWFKAERAADALALLWLWREEQGLPNAPDAAVVDTHFGEWRR